MGQSVSALKCCFGTKSSSYNLKTTMNTEDDRDLCNEEPFGKATFRFSPSAFSDQYDMQEKLEKCKGHIVFNADGSITLSVDSYADGYETIQQCFKSQEEEKLIPVNSSAHEAVIPVVVGEQSKEALYNGSERIEGATDNSQPNPPSKPGKHQKRNRLLVQNLTPQVNNEMSHSDRVVNRSLSQKLSVDEHLWHYMLFKHAEKVARISNKNNCEAKLVSEFSKDGVSYFFEVSPCMLDNYNEIDAKNSVDNAVEEFAELFKKLCDPPIVEERVKIPLELDKEEANGLKMSLDKMGFLLRQSELDNLIGPETHLEEAKNKVWEVISKHQKKTQSALKYSDEDMRFQSPNGLTVFVSQGDLIKQRVDAIVNPANGDLRHGGGAARAISKAAGHALEKECRDFISNGGSLSTTFVMHSTAGNLRPDIKFVIHAVGPRKSTFTSDEDLYQDVKTTVYNCLDYANSKLGIQSVAIPAISSGIFGVPLDIVAKASFDALLDFDRTLSTGQKVLREIHFLNNDKPTASGMRTAFANFVNRTFGSSVDPIATDKDESYTQNHGKQHLRNSSSASNESYKVAEKIKPLNFSSNNGSSENMNANNNPHSNSASKEDNMCIICMDEITDVKELPCKHRFCRECINNCFEKHQPKCPSCGKVFGVLKGNQPPGIMNFRENYYQQLPGYSNCGTIEIKYIFQSGKQKENHPNPGQSYRGTTRTAYLPANKEGREVLGLLRRAFDSNLLFTIGRSNTTGNENVIIWNDVHHKTSISGQYGYPDATYLKRVKEELAAKGIQ